MGISPAQLEEKPLASPPGEGWQDLGRGRGPSFVQNRDRRGAGSLLPGTGPGFAAWRWQEPCQAWRSPFAGRGTGGREAIGVRRGGDATPQLFPSDSNGRRAGSEITGSGGLREAGSLRTPSRAEAGSAPTPPGDPRPAAMGQGRLPAHLGLACCLLLLGGSGSLGSRGTKATRGPWEEEQGPVVEGGPWGRARYEAVKKHLGAVGALSKQYWQYLACKVWQEGCEEGEQEEEEEESSPSPGKHLPPFSPSPMP